MRALTKAQKARVKAVQAKWNSLLAVGQHDQAAKAGRIFYALCAHYGVKFA